ncbi:hypothetical protein GCM10022220_23270 [Actinocatenispora rupis]|uniref:Uncharacterized protein n=2 Tax=Actinocatenispora rupis TaxID=519421 RepID=A0A8J3J824_9ACTN|nr:hypothetical protein Aru02nite_27510 [Actinocatenispora rupis]
MDVMTDPNVAARVLARICRLAAARVPGVAAVTSVAVDPTGVSPRPPGAAVRLDVQVDGTVSAPDAAAAVRAAVRDELARAGFRTTWVDVTVTVLGYPRPR